MDPIIEKLNLLKKLAQEKKIVQKKTVSSQSENKVTPQSQSPQQQQTPIQQASTKKPDTLLTNEPTISASSLNLGQTKQTNKKREEEEQKKLNSENEQNRKEEATDRNFLRPQPLSDSRNRSTSIDNSHINSAQAFAESFNQVRFGSSSGKPLLKSFTVNHAPQENTATFKYINRIRDLYDRERASSTDAINAPILNKTNKYGSSFQGIRNSPLKKLTSQFDSSLRLDQTSNQI